jgi:hypothetical protein
MQDGKLDEETMAGLREVLREAAEQPKDDVILQALHVMCGAQAIGCESPCAPRGEP